MRKDNLFMSCGDARSNIDCNSCKFKFGCSESDEHWKYIGWEISKCSKERSDHAHLGHIKYCSNCGAPMKHGVIPKTGNIQWID